MMEQDLKVQKSYDSGFSLNKLFLKSTLGIQTQQYSFAISFEKNTLADRMIDFYDTEKSNQILVSKYGFKDTSEWNLDKKRIGEFDPNLIVKIDYRLFDTRYIYYSNDLIDRNIKSLMQHLVKPNIVLTVSKQQNSSAFRHLFISKNIQDSCLISSQTKEGGYSLPLYLYPETTTQQVPGQIIERVPNLDIKIVEQFAQKLGLAFVPEKEPEENACYINSPEVRDDYKITFIPIDILDYIYAVLYSPGYRKKYKDYLKIDFPRVPYPKDTTTFWQLVNLGAEIRQVHLLEKPFVDNFIAKYSMDGDNVVVRPKYEYGKVYINNIQYFDNISETEWSFYIGDYQPAREWLEDRKGHKLEFKDILHYQKIIVALSETARLMKDIDKIEIES